ILFLWLGRNPWLFLLTLISAAAVLVFLYAKRASDRGHYGRALGTATPAIWAYAFSVVVLYPLGLPHSEILVVVPIVLAIPHLRRYFRLVMVGTALCAMAV